MTMAPHHTAALPSDEGEHGLHVSAYDQVASGIVALLVVLGVLVAVMAMLYFTRRALNRKSSVAAVLVEEIAGRGDHPEGFDVDFREPSLDQLQDLLPVTEQLLTRVTEVAATQIAHPDFLEGKMAMQIQGRGDARRPGPLSEGADIVPRWERWEILFSSDSLDAYARQLDFFQIELAAIGGGIARIDYVQHLSDPNPTTRTGPGDSESRLYMTWRDGELRQADTTLLARAGIETEGRLAVQFFSENLENELAQLERSHAGQTDLERIYRTIFGVKQQGDRYQFHVVDQVIR